MNFGPDIQLIIDSNFIAHQARYALRTLSKEGEDIDFLATGVIFGFLARVLSFGKMFGTNRFIFCWDSKHSLRKQKYPWYKQNRHEASTPEEAEELRLAFIQFVELRRNILPAMGFRNVFVQKGHESDDLIARIVEEPMGDFIIITSDNDLNQLLHSNVRLYNPTKKEMMTPRRLVSELGVTPSQWVRVKQIGGCTSDTIPGVAGVRTKTAIKYLCRTLKETTKAYKGIESAEGQAVIERNLWLVQLPLPTTKPITLQPDAFSLSGFQDMCTAYGLRSFLKEDRLKEWEDFFKGRLVPPKRKVVIHEVDDN